MPNLVLVVQSEALYKADPAAVVLAHQCDVLVEMFGSEWRGDYLRGCSKLLVFFPTPASESLLELREALRRQRKLSLASLVEEMLAERIPPDRDEETRWLLSSVAVPYTLVDAQQPTAHSRWAAARVTAEAALGYIAYVTLAPITAARHGEEMRHLSEEVGTMRPSLGHFVQVIERGRRSLLERLPAVDAALWRPRGKRTQLGEFVFNKLVSLRNKEHHGGALSEREFIEMYGMLRPRLDELLVALSQDSRSVVLVVQHKMEFVDDEDKSYDYWLTELRGGAIALPQSRVISRARLKRGRVYLSLPDGEFVDADPLIRFDSCPKCGLSEAFLLDRFEADAPLWRNSRGHELTAPSPSERE